MFQVPDSGKPVIEKDNLIIDVDESGIFRTPLFRTLWFGHHDEFFYKHLDPNGRIMKVRVPKAYYCLTNYGSDSCYPAGGKPVQGGIVTDDIEPGRAVLGRPRIATDQGTSSLVLFIGPPRVRADHLIFIPYDPGTKTTHDHPENDPIPGRLRK